MKIFSTSKKSATRSMSAKKAVSPRNSSGNVIQLIGDSAEGIRIPIDRDLAARRADRAIAQFIASA